MKDYELRICIEFDTNSIIMLSYRTDRLLRILQTLFTVNRAKKISRLERIKTLIENWVFELRIADACKNSGFNKEVNFIRTNGITDFPYEQLIDSPNFEYGIDSQNHLPYVVHKGKKLFFPQSFTLDFCKMLYKRYIDTECILGGHYREKCPHQYQTESFCIKEGDILVDVGCAEALLSLDAIDKVSKVYLLETDKKWIQALNETFKDYSDKVVIINKFASGTDSDSTITLKSLLCGEVDKSLFIKMDIEGAEVEVLNGSKEFLKSVKNLKLACCTYHRQDDAEEIEKIYKELNLNFEYSDGYMIFVFDECQKPPYFRHGVIRGWKQ